MKVRFFSSLVLALGLSVLAPTVVRADEAADKKAEIVRKKEEARKKAEEKKAAADKAAADKAGPREQRTSDSEH